ncbi:hypothetical protein HMPREF0444_1181 [Granulicatella adiacens ATCC 49175]|uniref:Uncharacterized protein n=1 Tax=Granulicatella adiacens ATCC 49175 TaxID=638301 RepID=C8NGY6_9LACT|nr:hypothetical protein HMPREF0444_1181 [Granulicatella adiacens ATCC 49175]
MNEVEHSYICRSAFFESFRKKVLRIKGVCYNEIHINKLSKIAILKVLRRTQ